MHNSPPLKIMHLSTAHSWRGGENQLYLLARGLRERGHLALVAAPPDAPLFARCRAAGIDVRALKIRGGADVLGAWKLARLVRAERPDILHAHDGHAIIPAKLALLLAGTAGKNTLLVAHRRTIFKIKSRSKYSGRVDRVIAISQAARESLLSAGVSAQRLSVVFSGMEFPDALGKNAPGVLEFREKFQLPPRAFIIAHAAALTAEKRQGDMLDALARTNAALAAAGVPADERTILMLAGSGELGGVLRARAQALGVDAHTRFVGFLDDLRPLWASASLALFASEAEGLCTALIEAQGAGVAALVSRAGGMTEVIEDGTTGVIFEVGDVETLSRLLLEFFRDRPRGARLGCNAAQRARALFSSSAMIGGVLDVYQELKAGVRQQ